MFPDESLIVDIVDSWQSSVIHSFIHSACVFSEGQVHAVLFALCKSLCVTYVVAEGELQPMLDLHK